MPKVFKVRLADRNYLISKANNTNINASKKRFLQDLFKRILKNDLHASYTQMRLIYPKNREFELFYALHVNYDKSRSQFTILSFDEFEQSYDELVMHLCDDVPLVYLDEYYKDEASLKIQQRNAKQKEQRESRKQKRDLIHAENREAFANILGQADQMLKEELQKDIEAAKVREKMLQELVPEKKITKITKLPQKLMPKKDKTICFTWEDQTYTVVKTKHLFEKRNKKRRIGLFTDKIIKVIFQTVMEDPKVLHYNTFAVLLPKDKEPSTYYSFLVNFNVKTRTFRIITMYAEDKQYKKYTYFPNTRNKVILEHLVFDALLAEELTA